MIIPPRVLAIMLDTCEQRGVSLELMLSPARTRRVYAARAEAMRLVAQMQFGAIGHASSVQIGAWFNRHHASVLNTLGRLSPRAPRRRHQEIRALAA